MGLGTLVTRTGTILNSFFDDIRAILIADFVGRNSSGAPTAGNNLGNSLYPWGAVYADTIVVDGTALDETVFENQPFKIVSGAVRATSNQPAFLQAASPAAPSFSVLGTAVPLLYEVSGLVTQLTTDITGIAVSVAPATQNTATLNDVLATGQFSTKTWGEIGSGQLQDGSNPLQDNYYPITMSSAGTAITARIGTLQAFKLSGTGVLGGPEYFIGYVESSTLLSRAFRGFFFDNTGTPLKRCGLISANGVTITLMNLGWVFADSNGTTIDTIFVGTGGTLNQNSPTYSYSAPVSPFTNDYWFDLGNQVWKKYSGSWQVVSRTLIGMVVADGTNCVATRSGDFYGLCRTDNTVVPIYNSATVIKGLGNFERINVNGKRIDFTTSRPTWDQATNVPSSAGDRYNSTIQDNSVEFLYISDLGQSIISDVEPYYRPDLLGRYHPHNPWRYVAHATTDASANFQVPTSSSQGIFYKANTPLLPFTIPRTAIAPPNTAISISSGSINTSTSSAYAAMVNQSVPLTCNGNPVEVFLQPDGSTNICYIEWNQNPSGGTPTAAEGTIAIYRNGTLLASQDIASYGSAYLRPPITAFRFVDYFPPIGNNTYAFYIKVSSGGEINYAYIVTMAKEW